MLVSNPVSCWKHLHNIAEVDNADYAVGVIDLDTMIQDQASFANALGRHTTGHSRRRLERLCRIGELHTLMIGYGLVVEQVEVEARHDVDNVTR